MAIWNERIHERRIEKGVTLAQIAERLGVTEATAQRYERGNIKSIPYEHMCAYGEILNCSPCYLMGWENKERAKDEPPKILQYYESLNALGKEAATEHVRLLTLDEKYTRPDEIISIVKELDTDYLEPDAAHERTGAEIKEDDRLEDEKMID